MYRHVQVLSSQALYYLTLASARYRHPMEPVLMLLTAIALRWKAR